MVSDILPTWQWLLLAKRLQPGSRGRGLLNAGGEGTTARRSRRLLCTPYVQMHQPRPGNHRHRRPHAGTCWASPRCVTGSNLGRCCFANNLHRGAAAAFAVLQYTLFFFFSIPFGKGSSRLQGSVNQAMAPIHCEETCPVSSPLIMEISCSLSLSLTSSLVKIAYTAKSSDESAMRAAKGIISVQELSTSSWPMDPAQKTPSPIPRGTLRARFLVDPVFKLTGPESVPTYKYLFQFPTLSKGNDVGAGWALLNMGPAFRREKANTRLGTTCLRVVADILVASRQLT